MATATRRPRDLERLRASTPHFDADVADVGGPRHGADVAASYADRVRLVEVRFEAEVRFVMVEPGTTLLEAGRLAGVEIAHGCTRGMCGTDAVRVDADDGALEPPTEQERGTLERMGLDGGFRLSCSARVRTGVVRVRSGEF